MEENSESVGGRLFETLVDYGKESYSSQVLEWTMEVAMVEAVLKSR